MGRYLAQFAPGHGTGARPVGRNTRGKTGSGNPSASLNCSVTHEELVLAVKIKLTRLGKIRNPQYRVAVADARTRRDGRAIG